MASVGVDERRGLPPSRPEPAAPIVRESDETLMRRAGGGDRDACGELVERHLGRIVAFAGRTLGDRTAAEDVAQEVFLRLWKHARRWHPGRARLTTWLHCVALNLCRDRLARPRDVPLEEGREPADPRPQATALLQQRDIARHVAGALADLGETQRIAITLCHYQGLSNIEAAEIMGVSVKALESLLARGRRALRSRLRELVPDLLGEE